MPQEIAFAMHPELLRSVIKKQAGSPDKAVLEAVMNSVDASATRIDITITPEKITLVDDGGGFPDREYIEQFFATFGTPHTEGDATYGKFRMGRGQMFAFGKNVWRSGTFQMNVDIDERLGFDLIENLPEVKGCSIEIDLYEPLDLRDMYAVSQELRRMVKYVSIPVVLNGEVVSEAPNEQKFKDSTDDAYINLTESSSLLVYNLGVFVQSIHSNQFGVGGTIVSKKQLDVNFARNQVLASCPIWRRIKAAVDARGEREVKQKQVLSDAEIENVIARIVDGTARAHEFKTARIFKDVTGRAWSASQIAKAKWQNFTVAERLCGIGDKLMQSRAALVLDERWVRKFHVEPSELFTTYNFNVSYRDVMPPYASFETLSAGMDSSCIPLPREKWTPKERVWVELIRIMMCMANFEEGQRRRDIRIGLSSTADAWTDGSTYITFSRSYLRRLNVLRLGAANARDIMDVVLVLCHELCHDTDSRENVHSPEFYQAYHDMSIRRGRSMLTQGLGKVSAAWYKKAIERNSKGIKDPEVLALDLVEHEPTEEFEPRESLVCGGATFTPEELDKYDIVLV